MESKIWDKWTYFYETETEAQRQSRWVVAKEEEVGWRDRVKVGVSRHKLLYIEWINNKVLLYSTENYIQHPMINHNGKEYFKKEYVYIYIY